MSDFETVLRQYVTEQSATADARYTLDPTGEARVLAWRVRRRRASRVGGVAAVAAAAVLVASAGVYAATRPEAVPPAGTPTPSVSPTPEESPAEDVDPGEQPAVTGSALLPTSLPLEPGMLAAAPAGSTLVTFVATCGYPCAEPESAPTLYLVTPDGGIFDAGLDVADLSLTDWLPGTSVALFARYDGAESAWVAVDVETGSSSASRCRTIPGARGTPGSAATATSCARASTGRTTGASPSWSGSPSPTDRSWRARRPPATPRWSGAPGATGSSCGAAPA